MLNETLLAEAILGRDAEEFLSTELGRYITGRCEQEIAEAQELLNRVSPWRRRRIQDLQNQIYRAQSLREWVAELVSNGRQAEAALSEQET